MSTYLFWELVQASTLLGYLPQASSTKMMGTDMTRGGTKISHRVHLVQLIHPICTEHVGSLFHLVSYSCIFPANYLHIPC